MGGKLGDTALVPEAAVEEENGGAWGGTGGGGLEEVEMQLVVCDVLVRDFCCLIEQFAIAINDTWKARGLRHECDE